MTDLKSRAKPSLRQKEHFPVDNSSACAWESAPVHSWVPLCPGPPLDFRLAYPARQLCETIPCSNSLNMHIFYWLCFSSRLLTDITWKISQPLLQLSWSYVTNLAKVLREEWVRVTGGLRQLQSKLVCLLCLSFFCGNLGDHMLK